jgi:ferredoxin
MEERHGGTRTRCSPDRLVTNRWTSAGRSPSTGDACLGPGMCAATAPRRFRPGDGKSRALQEDIEPGDTVLDIAGTCPAEAIIVYNAAGHRVAPDTA